MKYWHKRVTVGSFYNLSEEAQNEELGYDDNARENRYLIADDGQCWDIGMFEYVKGSRYHGVMIITNTSAIGAILSRDGESAVIQCFG